MTEDEELDVRKELEAERSLIETANHELESYVRQVCARLEREEGLRYRQVESRLKSANSTIRKLNEKDADLTQMYEVIGDLIGSRVVVYNLSDAERLLECLLGQGGAISSPYEERICNSNGYRAIHVNGRIGKYRCEVQIRTAVQDAWAVTSRADVYREDIDILVSTLSEAQASILGGVDEVLQAIRDLTEKSREPVPEVTAEVTPGPVTPPQEPPITLDEALLTEARRSLTPDEVYVLGSDVSESRISRLREGVASERDGSPIQGIFRAAGRFERVFEFIPEFRFGGKFYTWKGPLVEGSNWVNFFPTDFAQAFEDFLMAQFTSILGERVNGAAGVDSADNLLAFVGATREEFQRRGRTADLIVKHGRTNEEIETNILRNIRWQDSAIIRGTSPVADLRVFGGLPILSVWNPDTQPTIHVVDLDDFSYRKTNPSEASNEDLSVTVDLIDEEAATQAISREPGLMKSLYRSFRSEGGEFSPEEAVVRLQLQVIMAILEAGRITALPNASWASVTLPAA